MKKMDPLSMISRAVKTGNLKNKIFCWVLIKLGYSNQTLQALETRNKFFKKNEKKIKEQLNEVGYREKFESEFSNKVWFCWLQGIENAPDVVKICYQSAIKWLPEKEIVFIDAENYDEFVTLPDFIVKNGRLD